MAYRNTTKEELDAFGERFPDTSDDWGPETKSVRDMQILLSYGLEFEADFEDLQGLVTPSNGRWVCVTNGAGERLDHIADDAFYVAKKKDAPSEEF